MLQILAGTGVMRDRESPETTSPSTRWAEAGSTARDRLLAHKDRILARWVERLRTEVAAAGREPDPIIVNTIPAVLQQLAQALSPDHPRRTATQGSTVAQEHGGERVRLTSCELQDLVAVYKILREVLFAILEEEEPLSREERTTINISVDQAIIEACTG